MDIKQYIYLCILITLILLPFVISRKHLSPFLNNAKYYLPAILFSEAIFILWDKRFAGLQIWEYHGEFLTGTDIGGLPLEEWIFFFAMPFFSFYVYERVKSGFSGANRPNFSVALSLVLLILFIGLAWNMRQKLYPFFTFFLLSVYFGYTIFRNRFKKHLTMFYITFLISLVPFMAIRITISSVPLVTFNIRHTTGFSIFSAPAEDLGYLFLLLIMNITIYEYLRERRYY